MLQRTCEALRERTKNKSAKRQIQCVKAKKLYAGKNFKKSSRED